MRRRHESRINAKGHDRYQTGRDLVQPVATVGFAVPEIRERSNVLLFEFILPRSMLCCSTEVISP
jgi:hypothetical protein